MPKRKINREEFDKIKKKLRKLSEKLKDIDSSSESSYNSSSDESDNSQKSIYSKDNHGEVTVVEIHPPPLEILGEDPLATKNLGPEIHPEIANRWKTFSRKGIDKVERKTLTEKYSRPINAEGLLPPELNSEVIGCLSDTQTKQDKFIMRIQEQVATAVSALAKPMNLYFTEPSEETAPHLQSLADATKLLTDVMYSLSAHRRYCLANSLNSSIRKVVMDRPIDSLLFGADISSHIKSAQEVKKLSSELKNKPILRPKTNSSGPSTHRPGGQDFLSRKYKYTSRKKPEMNRMDPKFRKNQRRSDYRRSDYRKKN